jgi:hypothetical protein
MKQREMTKYKPTPPVEGELPTSLHKGRARQKASKKSCLLEKEGGAEILRREAKFRVS